MIELAVKYRIKAVSFEKPMAEDMAEAKKMTSSALPIILKLLSAISRNILSRCRSSSAR